MFCSAMQPLEKDMGPLIRQVSQESFASSRRWLELSMLALEPGGVLGCPGPRQ
jgi:hypothetical protein